jgi:transcriptional antiterminator NusG
VFWYVLFVKTGYEDKVVNEIKRSWKVGEIRPFVPKRDSKFRKAGKVILEKCCLLPGYIFPEIPNRFITTE